MTYCVSGCILFSRFETVCTEIRKYYRKTKKGKTYAVDASEVNTENITSDSLGSLPGLYGSRGGFEITGKPSLRKID